MTWGAHDTALVAWAVASIVLVVHPGLTDAVAPP